MILTGDLQTLSWHQVIIDSNIRVTICPDIKSSSIPSSASRFSYHTYLFVSFIIPVRVFKQVYHELWAECLEVYKEDYFQIKAYSYLEVVVWEEYPRLLLMKATSGSHDKWWIRRLAGRSISPTLEDVNISFNYPLYHSISRGDGKVVTNK